MTQPTTAAGRKLSKAWRARDSASPGLNEAWPEQFDRYILAIEAEAATLDVDDRPCQTDCCDAQERRHIHVSAAEYARLQEKER